MKTRRPIYLTKRYNKDTSISLLGWKGRVVFKSNDLSAINAFVKGWYGDNTIRFNKSIFSKGA